MADIATLEINTDPLIATLEIQAVIETGGGGGGGSTNLSPSRTSTTVTIASDTGTDATVVAADSSLAGVMTAAQFTKLSGIATGATANSSDATLLARANHTGTQAISTVNGLQVALDAKDSNLNDALEGVQAALDAATIGCATVIHDDGTRTNYPPATDTDAARGTALATAVAAAVSGETVAVGPGTFALGNAVLALADNVDLSMDSNTVITSTSAVDGGSPLGPIIQPGTNSVITGGTIYGTLTNGVSQAPIGMATAAGGATGVILRGVRMIADSDGIIWGHATDACSMVAIGCIIETKYDAVILGGGAATTLDMYNCRMVVTGPSNVGGTISRGVVCGFTGVLRVFGGSISVTDGGTGINAGALINDSGATIELYDVAIRTSNGANPNYDLNNELEGTLIVSGGSGSGTGGAWITAGTITRAGADYAAAGTVTSVGWTGGIVSVATATTTPAFAVAGTSGGIPYFSSASTWATSAALAASALVIGGGAGAAPATTATGTGVIAALGVNVGSAGAIVINGGALGTPSSGTLTNCTGLPVAGGGTGVATATAYAVLCGGTTGTGALQSVSGVGTSGQVLTSNGAGALPTWQNASASGTKTIAVFKASDNEPPASNFATLDTRNSHIVLDFDTSTQEKAVFRGVIPEGAVLTNGITVSVHWMATSATSGTIGWDASFERLADGGQDADSDGFGTAQTITAATVPASSGVTKVTSVTFTQAQLPTSLAAGDEYRLCIRRDVANDTAAGDAELRLVKLQLP